MRRAGRWTRPASFLFSQRTSHPVFANSSLHPASRILHTTFFAQFNSLSSAATSGPNEQPKPQLSSQCISPSSFQGAVKMEHLGRGSRSTRLQGNRTPCAPRCDQSWARGASGRLQSPDSVMSRERGWPVVFSRKGDGCLERHVRDLRDRRSDLRTKFLGYSSGPSSVAPMAARDLQTREQHLVLSHH